MVLSDLFFDIIFGGDFLSGMFGWSYTHINIQMSIPIQPFFTNGEWNENGMKVQWQEITIKDGDTESYPDFCYAFWSLPDEGFQKAHFGKLILEGEDLAEYCLWRDCLSKNESKEWDEFISGLKPNDDLLETLESFGFSESVSDSGDEFSPPTYLFMRNLEAGSPDPNDE